MMDALAHDAAECKRFGANWRNGVGVGATMVPNGLAVTKTKDHGADIDTIVKAPDGKNNGCIGFKDIQFRLAAHDHRLP